MPPNSPPKTTVPDRSRPFLKNGADDHSSVPSPVRGTGRVAGAQERSTVPTRLALGLDEAAQALGCSRDYFDEHVRHEIRTVRRGRRVLIPVKELERWLERSASKGSNEPARAVARFALFPVRRVAPAA